MRILIIGGGYVGLATTLMFKEHDIYLYDKYEINQELYFSRSDFNFKIIDNLNIDVDLIFICVPTPQLDDTLDTSIVEHYIKLFRHRKIVVRSTVPIGFCKEHGVDYMPEFLTEKEPFKPSRQVYGGYPLFPINGLICSTTEAEIIKLGANAYLSMRLAYFYEIKKLSEQLDCHFDSVKSGICADERIGFRYADEPYLIKGKCLPKDLNELSQFTNSPLFKAINCICKKQYA